MKAKLAVLGTILVVAAGTVSATSIDFKDDNFFKDSDFFEDDSSDPFFEDDWFNDDKDKDQRDRDKNKEKDKEKNPKDKPGCQEGEYHIPEDTDCDGEIEDRFKDGHQEPEAPEQPQEPEMPEDSSNESEVGICIIGVDSPCNSEEFDGDEETIEEPETPREPETPGTPRTPGDDNSDTPEEPRDDSPEENPEEDTPEQPEDDTEVEEKHVTPAPEPDYVGDDYISYPNPRDHYKHPEVHREGSIKVCKIMLNQNGEIITGETVEGTTFTVETDIPYEDAQPVSFETPVNQVADLVGTSEDLIEGDGYLDAECAEFHDLRLNQTYYYGQETIAGPDSERIEVVGYEEYWERTKPPLKNPEPYGTSESSDGQVTLTPGDGNRHAEIIIVNQITG